MKFTRRNILQYGGAIAATSIVPSLLSQGVAQAANGEIQVGVLFSLTGGLSVVEKSISDATLMAIDEINKSGGINGAVIKPIVEDGASDPATFNEKAGKLVIRDRVPTIFGGYTTASRWAIQPVVEKRKGLLFYPTFYEGSECSKNIVYTGAVPNLQLANFIPWIINNLGKKKFFIVGSNYGYPQEMAKVSKFLIEKHGGEWIADEYLSLGHSEWGAMVNKIKNSGCDVVLSNVVGDSVIAFYREFINQGLKHEDLPICATVTSEIEVKAMGARYAAGSYSSFPYLQAIDTPENKAFIERFRKFTGDPKAVTHHAMESAYFQVFLWAKLAKRVKIVKASELIAEAEKGATFKAPSGEHVLDGGNLHVSHTPRIAQWQADGSGKIVDEYDSPIAALPYSAYGETTSNLICTITGADNSKL
jgi:urea transport system substrate-binding protein